MNKIIGIIIVIVLIVLVILGGLLAYSYTQIHVDLNDVNFHSIDWTSFSFTDLLGLGFNAMTGNVLGAVFNLIDGINLNLIFGLTNNGFLSVYIPDISYDLFLNGVPVGQGKSTIDTTINPGQTKQITAFQNFKKSSLMPSASAIIANGGIIDLKVSGTAYFKLFVLSIPIPFESSKQVSIIDEVKKKIGKIQKQNTKYDDDYFTKEITDQITKLDNPSTLGSAHTHASILVKIFGDTFEFSSPAFQIKSSWIHFEGKDGATIHKHATGVDLGYLFETLAIGLDDQCYIFPDGKRFCSNEDYKLNFFINREQISDIRDYEIQESDKVLILYGSETPEEVESYLLQLDHQIIVN